MFSFSEGKYYSSWKQKSALGITVAHEPARTYISTLCGQKREGVSHSKNYIYIYIINIY